MTKVYTVMVRCKDPETVVFIPQSSSFIAVFFPLLWGISKGLILFTGLVAFITVMAFFLLPWLILIPFLIVFQIWIGLEAPFFIEKSHKRRGYTVDRVVLGRNLFEAEEHFFRERL